MAEDVLREDARSFHNTGPVLFAMAALPTTSLLGVHGIGTLHPGAGWWQRREFSSTLSRQRSWLTTKLCSLAGLGLGLNKRLARKVLVRPASEFEQFFEEGPTELAYAGTPVSGLTQHEQGRRCQEWAKEVLQEKNPEAEILDPEPEQCCNGVKRGRNQASYDFLLGGPRVEIKSARIAWESISKGGRWQVQFANIKLACKERTEPAFDDLYLVIVSPSGLHVIKHDLVTRGRGTREVDCGSWLRNKGLRQHKHRLLGRRLG